MNWKVILGGFVFFLGMAEIINDLLNWDGDFYEMGRSIIIAIVGYTMFIEGRKKALPK